MARSGTLRQQFPVVTMLIVSASLITYAAPQLNDLLLYDRQQVLDGQLWRFFTAPFVHFSASHLIWNLLVFATAGFVTELAGYRQFGSVCILAIIVPGMLFFATNPDLSLYGGISALSVSATAYLCLFKAQLDSKNRRIWIAIFVLLVVKIFFESTIDAPIFAKPATIPFRVLPSAHVVGVAAAVVVFVYKKR